MVAERAAAPLRYIDAAAVYGLSGDSGRNLMTGLVNRSSKRLGGIDADADGRQLPWARSN
jgi:hypothetical protein